MRHLDIYIDGASKGNPGPSGIGVVICHNAEAVKNISEFIGNATNNIAEYTALIYALKEAVVLKADTLEIRTDSQLLARQINKVYKIRNERILDLHKQAASIMSSFKNVIVNHIPRESNKGADKLANQAVKKALKSARV